MTLVLAVDDDPEVLETLERVLLRENFDVDLARSGAEALMKLERRVPDLLILDIIMPGLDGIAVCSQLRADPRFVNLPILFLTAKGSTDDIVEGLDAGADDYVIKPFDLAELRARIAALLRRSTRNTDSSSTLQVGDLKLDADTYMVHINDYNAQLTSTEYRLLRYLMENVDKALSPGHLLQAVWEYPPDTGDPDLVRAHVRNLRSKIERDKSRKYIRTIHGVGYMIST
ncbi:MAG: DNA-binding response regulator [Chloroflexi bacterium]|nr:MAG: DNA-binding response regulator [Phototrophicales bacterium]RMF82277.1 MAG: DNA-binding response regulator [Chloroflexota bacterium]